jgi:hypothetical protein
MNDQHLQKGNPEKFNFTPQETNKNPLGKEEAQLHETKISVGLEAGEILEGEELTSGEVSEKNRGQKDNYGSGTKNGQSSNKSNYELKLPQVKMMKKEIRKELQNEIKFLREKINSVMKKGGNVDAHSLNKMMMRLRQLREILSSLAHGATDLIKDLWIKYIHERKQRRKS